jgi:hypothetical protein
MWEWLSKPYVIFWVALAVIVVVPWALYYWRQVKQDQHEADLKREMIARGMSAEEIERVLSARSSQEE